MKYFARVGEIEREYEFERRGSELLARSGDEVLRLDVSMVGDGTAFSLIVDGRSHDCLVESSGRSAVVQMAGERIVVEVADERERAAQRVMHARVGGRRTITAAMPGVVVDVAVAAGQTVAEGETLVVLEAMKMQNPIVADGTGVVVRIAVATGEAVAGGAVLVELDSAEGT